jgi:hypothetical protein
LNSRRSILKEKPAGRRVLSVAGSFAGKSAKNIETAQKSRGACYPNAKLGRQLHWAKKDQGDR